MHLAHERIPFFIVINRPDNRLEIRQLGRDPRQRRTLDASPMAQLFHMEPADARYGRQPLAIEHSEKGALVAMLEQILPAAGQLRFEPLRVDVHILPMMDIRWRVRIQGP